MSIAADSPVAGADSPAADLTVFVFSQLDPPQTHYVSPAFAELTGYDPAVMASDTGWMAQLVHPDDLQVAARLATDCWSGRPAQEEVRIVRADGALRWIRISCSPIPALRAENQPRMVTTMNDVTARVLALQAVDGAAEMVQAAEAAKSMFLSRMSHELRTPLNAVIGFSQLLERRLLSPDDLSSVRYILTAGLRLLELINEVPDISRDEPGDHSLGPAVDGGPPGCAVPASAPPEVASRTLLYIQVNDPNVRVITSLLRLRPGWRLLHAGHGELGLELALLHHPDMVLLDLHLPDMFGLDVLAALKADPVTTTIPVVVLTGDPSSPPPSRLLAAGATYTLTKPLNVREVLRLLDGITADQPTRMVDA